LPSGFIILQLHRLKQSDRTKLPFGNERPGMRGFRVQYGASGMLLMLHRSTNRAVFEMDRQ
jgi:hypothetical protein